MWYVLVAAGILICAILAISSKRLLISAIWLAVTSALVALMIYLLGAPQVAVIELSVGAGLVTVLFVFARNFMGKGDAFVGCLSGTGDLYLHKPFYDKFKYHKDFFCRPTGQGGYLGESYNIPIDFDNVRETQTFTTNWSLCHNTQFGNFAQNRYGNDNFDDDLGGERNDEEVYDLENGEQLILSELEPSDVLFNISLIDEELWLTTTPRVYWESDHWRYR